jgi:protease-4
VSAAPLHRQLERALADPLTRGVLLDLRHVGGMAQLEELRPRIAALRAAGKPVTAYLEEGGGRADLYLASACDRVVASEEGDFLALGLRSERRYWREALARAGVQVERSSTGLYKSAYRNLSVNTMPAADSEVVLRDLEVRQRLFTDAVSRDRHLAPARLEPFLDGRAWSSGDLAAAGVIDSVGYREDALRIAGGLAGLGATPRTVDLRRAPRARREWTRPARIAVVYAGGGIELGRSGNDLLAGPTLGSTTLIAALERAFRARGVRAVVLRIESPGGSALASNLIDHAVQKLRRETKKPFIVSMGSLAGSGGYYIACHADRIYADRHTRTGAIGVLTIQPSFEGLYRKLHAHQEEFDRGDYMRGNSWSRDWTAREQAAADSTILRLYRGFVGKVAEGRRLTPEAVHAAAQGRVWLGEDAHERGLVDAIGGLQEALREARVRGGIPADETIRLLELGRPRGSFVERLLGGWIRETLAREARLPAFGSAQMLDPEALAPLAE